MKYWFLLLLACAFSGATAQSFADLETKKGANLYDETLHHLMFRYTNFSDPYTETIKGFTFNYALRKGGSAPGQANWHFENPTLGDFIYVLVNFKKWNSSTTDKSFGAGFFGWHQVYVNALVRDRLIIAPGICFGDYIFGIRQNDIGDPAVLEPNGYYFTLGPGVKASYVISKKLWVEGYVYNDIGFKASTPGGSYQKLDGYEKPYFFNVGGTLYSTSRFFGGFRVNKLIDRGAHNIKATRVDISVGYVLL